MAKPQNPDQMTHKRSSYQDQSTQPLTGSALQALARGWLAGTLGLPGDIESLGRKALNFSFGPGGVNVDTASALPTSDFYKEWLPGKQVGDENVATVGSLFGGAGVGTASKGVSAAANKAAPAIAGALTQAARNASVPRTLSTQAGVIKAPGGNWLSGSVEDALRGLKQTAGARGLPAEQVLAEMNAVYTPEQMARLSPESLAQVQRAMTEIKPGAALNSFIDKQLTRYVKNDMATERDPIRALAERGVLHFEPQVGGRGIQKTRAEVGYPEKGLAKEPLAVRWEDASDSSLRSDRVGNLLRGPKDVNAGVAKAHVDRSLSSDPWLAKLPPETAVYKVPSPYGTSGNLGFNHLIDELRNATNPNSGLPRELLLKPESLDRVSVPQAVEHVAKINAWREAQKVAANEAIANNAATHLFKEYADNNPKGLRWVELKQPEMVDEAYPLPEQLAGPISKLKDKQPVLRARALEDALRYEGDTMGHCVGGYCDDVASGASRIYSLRDAKGRPHVTVEVEPARSPIGNPEKYVKFSDLSPEQMSAFDEYSKSMGNDPMHLRKLEESHLFNPESGTIVRASEVNPPPRVVQIKGKGNKKPNDEYLPFVQDFVKSGKWSDVGDLHNTDLRRFGDAWNVNEEKAIRAAGVDIAPYLTQKEIDAINNKVWPGQYGTPPGFASGGPTPTAAEIQQFYAAHKDDPAALAAAMREHNVGTATAAQALGQTQEQLVNHINSGRVATPVMTGGPDPAATGAQTWNYEAITPEVTQTLEQFKQKYAHAIGSDGRFKGPQSGIDYAAEGFTPEEYYKANIGQQYARSGEYGSDQTPTKFNTSVNADWRKGPDNGGGVLGGVTRAVGGLAKGVMSNPALSMALGATLAPMVGKGLQSAGMSAGMAKTATPLVTGGLKTVAGGGSLADVAKNAGISYLGGEAGQLAQGATGLDIAGKAASTLTQSALRGKPLSLNALATQYAMGQLTDLSGLDPKMASIVVNLARNKRPSVTGALTTISSVLGGRKPQRSAAVG